MNAAIYPGTFDPITMGHVNIARRGLKLFDKIIIAVSVDTSKQCLFDANERVNMVRKTFADEPKIEVDLFEGLLANYALQKNINVILRAIRTFADFEYEYQMSAANRDLSDKLETILMFTDSSYGHLSSSLIREIATLGGDIDSMVPAPAIQQIKDKLA